jgi:hypothetical protein
MKCVPQIVVAAAVAGLVCTAAVTTIIGAQHDEDRLQGPIAGIHWVRGHARSHSSGGGSPDLSYHGGPVLTQGAYVEPIFWGTRWAASSFVADKITGVQTFYAGFGASTYEATTTEYTDSSGSHVGTSIALGVTHTDLSAAPRSGSRTSPILAEVCSKATNLLPDGYYPVYVDTPRGHAGFCAWHSAGTCPNGVTVQFAFFFDLDGDPGCDPQDTSGLHSEGMAALANVSGHELSEALTDPHLNAWYDSSGQENADKCAWSFGTPLLTFANRSKWKIQGNWSNQAFNTNSGYPNLNGQNGCIDGGNYK